MTPVAVVDFQFGVLAAGLDWSIAQLIIVGLVGLGAYIKNRNKPNEKSQKNDTPASKSAARPPAALPQIQARPVSRQPLGVRAKSGSTIAALLAPIRKALSGLFVTENAPAERPPRTPQIPVARAGRRAKVQRPRKVHPSVTTPPQTEPVARTKSAGLHDMLRTQSGLRRAVLLNEILSPPLALRDDHCER